MKANKISLLLMLCLTFTSVWSMYGCSSKEDIIQEAPFLKVETQSINFEQTGGEKEFQIQSNGDYSFTLTPESPWCSIVKNGNSLTVKASENSEKGIRKTVLKLTLGAVSQSVEIAQLGWGKAILLSASSVNMEAPGGKFQLDVTANVSCTYSVRNNSWITADTESRAADSHPMKTGTFHFSVEPNKASKRAADLIFFDSEPGSELDTVKCTVTQNGLDDYIPGSSDEVKSDIKVKIASGSASSFQSGANIEKSFDGDYATTYHSNWSNKGDDYFPITLEYQFENGSDMDYLIYYPRQDGSKNGLFKQVEIQVKSNANTRLQEEWSKVMDVDFGGSSTPVRVDFPQPLIGVSAVKMIVKSGAGDGQGFASCAEMEFYKKNPENFDWKELFTGPSCSELKPGVTEQEILACPYSLFKNIAFFMYYKKYPAEFRIASFKAYPHPDTEAAQNKTSSYSLLDNPTGIEVAAGDNLIVGAELGQGKVSLKVQNLDKPGGDGFGGDSYSLSEGINKIQIKNKGLIYVMYHTPDYQSAPSVKLHFISGDVNGYYDSENPSLKDRAQELLNNATGNYFDVVGKYAHLTFPTARFRNHTKDLKRLISYFDQIVYNEQLLLGLVKYNKMFHNRMYFNVMYHSYMYSTSYHTGYIDDTMPELCNDANFAAAVWGPAHEVGHSNQTRPGLKWLGTTEVTNNIMSEYIQTTVFKADSRVQVENMGDTKSPNRYSKAWNGILVPHLAHAVHDDVFCKLIPFWQLQLFMGNVLGKSPEVQTDHGGFYPDVYEYIRTHDNLQGAGNQQLEFVYIASKCSGYNLLDFFEKWGFLKEVDQELDDYGKGQITVTSQMADKIRERVNALELPTVNMPMEYITDNNYAAFRDKKAVVKGTSKRDGNVLTMTNWQNVIVYEVRDGGTEGALICASDGMNKPSSTASFSLPSDWKSSYKVYAVQYDNQRIDTGIN